MPARSAPRDPRRRLARVASRRSIEVLAGAGLADEDEMAVVDLSDVSDAQLRDSVVAAVRPAALDWSAMHDDARAVLRRAALRSV